MAVAGSWRIYGAVSGLPSGIRGVDVSIPVGTGVDVTQIFTPGGSGFTAMTVPTGYTAVLIIPPAGNANTITLKGITGDTGIALSKTLPTLLSLGASAAFGLTVGGAITSITLIWM